MYQTVLLTLDPSGVGKGWRSITVIDVSLYCGFRHSDQAVESPNAPDPTIRMDEGISADAEDAIALRNVKTMEETKITGKAEANFWPTLVRRSTFLWANIVRQIIGRARRLGTVQTLVARRRALTFPSDRVASNI
jgi:hypothetical protein